MAVLVFLEGPDLDVSLAVDFVSQDEVMLGQVVDEALDIPDRDIGIIGKKLHLDPRRTFFQTPGPVGEHPEPGEHQPGIPGAAAELIIEIEIGLDLSDTWHFIFLPWFSHCG
jgi:hypothetical protein